MREVSLIDLFVSAIEPAVESTNSFLWWSGAAAVSALIGKQAWTSVRSDSPDDRLFPNLFVLLIGPPGCGKTTAVSEARKILTDTSTRLGPDDVTGERLLAWCKTERWDEDGGDLAIKYKKGKRERSDLSGAEGVSRGTVAILLNEFSHFFHEGNAASLKRTLTDFYDCRATAYHRETNLRGTQKVEDMCMTLLGGLTPAHMSTIFQRQEWQEGLPSRFIYVYGERPQKREDFTRDSALARELLKLRDLVQLHASNNCEISWTSDAREARILWRHKEDEKSAPIHLLLAGYNTRRYVTACKLALVLAVSRLESEITLEDWQQSVERIVETEKDMDKALAQAGGNEWRASMVFMADVIRAVKRMEEWDLRRRLGQTCGPQYVEMIVEEMVASRLVRELGGERPNRTFVPWSESSTKQARESNVIPMKKRKGPVQPPPAESAQA